MSLKYLSVEAAAKRAAKEGFPRNVKEAVLPRLIKKGLLQGKKEKGQQLVADDEALARVLGLGVENFVYNQQGYSFMAVRAPIEQVAQKLKARPGITEYKENVKPQRMKRGAGVEPDEKVRHAFLVQMESTPEWCALLLTIHWFHSCDAIMATALTSALSKELKTLAVAAWDDDFSGSSVMVCEKGKKKQVFADESEEGGWEELHEFFHEQGLFLPESFIGVQKGKALLYVTDPSKVCRADQVLLKVPRPIESKGPHALEKLGMMAEAMEEAMEDEAAFMAGMHDGIWSQAETVLKSGEF